METISEIGKQVPALVVLSILVHWFLSHLRMEREFLSEWTAKLDTVHARQTEAIKTPLDGCNRELARSRLVMDRLDRKHDFAGESQG